MKNPVLLLVFFLFSGTSVMAGGNLADDVREDAERLHAYTHADSSLWDRIAEFCDRYPRRISGSNVLEDALDWLMATMSDEGWSVEQQDVMVPKWVRGKEYCHMHTRPDHAMPMMGLGGSVGTGGKPLTGSVLVVKSFDDLEARASEAKGKIVVWNVPFTTYGETVRYRYDGPSEAAKHGAIASLVRSIGPYGMQSPHTGGMGYKDGIPKIPAAAITMEDAMLMQRLQERGEPIELELYMEGHFEDDQPSRNIMIEIRGSEYPNEVVVMGGHIDAWDVGTGAMDDASGCYVTWRALEAIRSLGVPPKRTIRVCFWTNEENGGRGAEAYAEQTAGETHVIGMEVDGGTFQPTGFSGNVEGDLKRDVESLMTLTSQVGASVLEKGEGGADTGPLRENGVPVLELTVDTTKYFWYHHTEADTPDKLDPKELNDCAYAMAVMAWGIANR